MLGLVPCAWPDRQQAVHLRALGDQVASSGSSSADIPMRLVRHPEVLPAPRLELGDEIFKELLLQIQREAKIEDLEEQDL